MDFPLGAAIGSAADLGLGIYNDIQGKKVQQEQNEYNERMIDKQNAYNSPQNQMRLLKDAGLNPNAILQGNTLGGAIQQQANQSAERPRTDWSIQGQTIANLAQDADLKKAQAEKLRNDIEVDNQSLNINRENAVQHRLYEAAATSFFGDQAIHLQKQNDMIEASIDKIGFDKFQSIMNDYWTRQEKKSNVFLSSLQGQNIKWQTERSRQMFPVEFNLAKSTIAHTDADAGRLTIMSQFLRSQKRAFDQENFSPNFFERGVDPSRLNSGQAKVYYGLWLMNSHAGIANWEEMKSHRYVTSGAMDADFYFLQRMQSKQLDMLGTQIRANDIDNAWRSMNHMTNNFRNIGAGLSGFGSASPMLGL